MGLVTPYRALIILVAGEVSRLARYPPSPSSHDIAISRGSCLSANMITAFGTEYIQELVCDEHADGKFQILGEILNVEFILSLGGTVLIRIHPLGV